MDIRAASAAGNRFARFMDERRDPGSGALSLCCLARIASRFAGVPIRAAGQPRALGLAPELGAGGGVAGGVCDGSVAGGWRELAGRRRIGGGYDNDESVLNHVVGLILLVLRHRSVMQVSRKISGLAGV